MTLANNATENLSDAETAARLCAAAAHEALTDVEMALLLEGIFQHYGYDFRNYARPILKRRVLTHLHKSGLATISDLQARVLHDPAALEGLRRALTIPVTALFRDPSFYRAFRLQVVPLLRPYPFIRLWVSGCATGEEVHSLVILLHEEGLLERVRLYATDIDEAVLTKARSGLLPLAAMRQYTENYVKAGGQRDFSEYYVADHGHAMMRAGLHHNVWFAQHNLVNDPSFNEFHVILCRNVMIYFNPELRERVQQRLCASLLPLGVLCLGSSESLRGSAQGQDYLALNEQERIYRRTS